MIYFLVGLMGIGKSYVGMHLASELNCEFLDGDDLVPPKMAEKVYNFKLLKQGDLDDYVSNHLIPGVERRYQDNLVVAQALYRYHHRRLIKEHFGKDCVFIQIKAPLLLNLKRLRKRKRGIRWVCYGLFNLLFFQTEGIDHIVENDGNSLNLSPIIAKVTG